MATRKTNQTTTGQIELAQLGAAFLGAIIIPTIWAYAWLVTWLKHKGIGSGL